MNVSLSKTIPLSVLTVVLFTLCNTAWAQGTATGPATGHDVVPGPMVLIGSAASPIPIDLDPSGPPWTKGIFDSGNLIGGGGTLDIFETILNVGAEPWLDWHAQILPDSVGLVPSFWSSVVSLSINGTPITFNATGLGTADLWLDTFSQPVLPGDVLVIHQQANVFPNTAGADGTALIRMQQYPTPEPASAALVGLGGLMLLKRR